MRISLFGGQSLRSKPWKCCSVVAMSVGLWAPVSRAEGVRVPTSLQAELLSKVVVADKNFSARSAGKTHILIVRQSNDPDSFRVGSELEKALSDMETVGGQPTEVNSEEFSNAPALASACKSKKISVVILAPGLQDNLKGISSALSGKDLLTFATVGSYVSGGGAVVGLDVIGGKPKLLVHLGRAKNQHISFKSDILGLMKVVAE